MRGIIIAMSLVFLMPLFCRAADRPWHAANGPLMTRWANDVSPEKCLPEYPRPQMVRKDWVNLNGLWEYAITRKDQKKPAGYDGKILVPFAIESALSGVMKRVDAQSRLWYRRTFAIPNELQTSGPFCILERSIGRRLFTSTARRSAATRGATTGFHWTSPMP